MLVWCLASTRDSGREPVNPCIRASVQAMGSIVKEIDGLVFCHCCASDYLYALPPRGCLRTTCRLLVCIHLACVEPSPCGSGTAARATPPSPARCTSGGATPLPQGTAGCSRGSTPPSARPAAGCSRSGATRGPARARLRVGGGGREHLRGRQPGGQGRRRREEASRRGAAGGPGGG